MFEGYKRPQSGQKHKLIQVRTDMYDPTDSAGLLVPVHFNANGYCNSTSMGDLLRKLSAPATVVYGRVSNDGV